MTEIVGNAAENANPPAHLVMSALAELASAVQTVKLQPTETGHHALEPMMAAMHRAFALVEQSRAWLSGNSQICAAISGLSKRQRQVLTGIIRGRANKVIAWELGLSVRTVEAYRGQLIERLGARNTADAIRLALDAGFDRSEEFRGRK
jgi:two-component system response regulator FixJ